jgi:DNA-binding PadR family transcriptional regulator
MKKKEEQAPTGTEQDNISSPDSGIRLESHLRIFLLLGDRRATRGGATSQEIARILNMHYSAVCRNSSYLAVIGLVGVSGYDQGERGHMKKIWALTAKGREAYRRFTRNQWAQETIR